MCLQGEQEGSKCNWKFPIESRTQISSSLFAILQVQVPRQDECWSLPLLPLPSLIVGKVSQIVSPNQPLDTFRGVFETTQMYQKREQGNKKADLGGTFWMTCSVELGSDGTHDDSDCLCDKGADTFIEEVVRKVHVKVKKGLNKARHSLVLRPF